MKWKNWIKFLQRTMCALYNVEQQTNFVGNWNQILMLFQLAASAIVVKGMDILIVGLLGLKEFSSWNLSPEF